jgi:hypothetical protein
MVFKLQNVADMVTGMSDIAGACAKTTLARAPLINFGEQYMKQLSSPLSLGKNQLYYGQLRLQGVTISLGSVARISGDSVDLKEKGCVFTACLRHWLNSRGRNLFMMAGLSSLIVRSTESDQSLNVWTSSKRLA